MLRQLYEVHILKYMKTLLVVSILKDTNNIKILKYKIS